MWEAHTPTVLPQPGDSSAPTGYPPLPAWARTLTYTHLSFCPPTSTPTPPQHLVLVCVTEWPAKSHEVYNVTDMLHFDKFNILLKNKYFPGSDVVI